MLPFPMRSTQIIDVREYNLSGQAPRTRNAGSAPRLERRAVSPEVPARVARARVLRNGQMRVFDAHCRWAGLAPRRLRVGPSARGVCVRLLCVRDN